jgi:general secretion pathway protein F
LPFLPKSSQRLLKAGLPLDRCLEILIGLSANEPVRQLMTQMREEVRGGAALSKAMEAHPASLQPVLP